MAVVFIVYILILVVMVTLLVVRHRKLKEQLNEARYTIKNCHSFYARVYRYACRYSPPNLIRLSYISNVYIHALITIQNSTQI